ncbi:hypothetical protein COT02_01590 [Candidatus Roizmanbacteria bacterium CG07_land_8_20_14_0_80_34_15]|uniref:Uncharacterized protein n=1 Tax=Candidatus Roizmanbacteria bacterium CG07_land_8_20_14_0_80_34_15 TaxID=1974849 RepID=A0A2M6YV69_9BACT|nr:MAG: hypothetical protein COT02_01590 [Candidatus Roizmanbacteria bacterium CG07_land_8_20_14_0_80_34_15]
MLFLVSAGAFAGVVQAAKANDANSNPAGTFHPQPEEPLSFAAEAQAGILIALLIFFISYSLDYILIILEFQ